MDHLLKAWRRIFSPKPPRPAGRPVGSGYWSDGRDFERDFWVAVQTLEESDRRPTQESVARILGCDPRTLRRWLGECGICWTDAKRRSYTSKF